MLISFRKPPQTHPEITFIWAPLGAAKLTHKISHHRLKTTYIYYVNDSVGQKSTHNLTTGFLIKLQSPCWPRLGFINVQLGKVLISISVICGLSDCGPQLPDIFGQMPFSVSCHVCFLQGKMGKTTVSSQDGSYNIVM